MNSDIRISVSFLNHRKRKRLRIALGPGSTDYLIDLWISTAMNRPDGVLSGMDELDISLDAGWEGDPKAFVSALVSCGFMDIDADGTYCLHDWEDHQGYAVHAEDRKEKAKKAAAARWGKNEHAKSNANDMQQACSEHAKSNAPSPAPIPTPSPTPDPEKTEEKEENTSCPEPLRDSEPEPVKILSPVVLTIPVKGKAAGDYEVTEAAIADWQESFPAVDVLQALRSIRQWNLAHPERQKTRKGVVAHIVGWLDKEQNKPRHALPMSSRASPQQSPIMSDKTIRSMNNLQDWVQQ